MTGCSVYDRGVGDVFAIVDEDCPDVDEGEQGDVCELLERENEREDVVGEALHKAINRVEGVRCIGCGYDPFVMGFVEGFVDSGMVQTAVDPIDEEIGEKDKERELEIVV